MVLITRRDSIRRQIRSKRKVLVTSSLAIICLSVPLLMCFVDPITILVKYKLRLANGSILFEVLEKELLGPHLSVYLFNITNADRFMTGEDRKLKVQEVGPFVYQEYRTNNDLVLDTEAGVLRYTPELKTIFIPEESIAHPKDINVTMLNIPMVSLTQLMSPYPFLIRQIYNFLTLRLKSKAIITIDAQKYLWGYPESLIDLANKLVPGLIYFNTTGLLDRLYDATANYRLELGVTNTDKFSVKSVKKYLHTKISEDEGLSESTAHFTNTYEGGAFPPEMTPEMPIKLYRQSICKTFEIEYFDKKPMEYGGDAFVYKFHNRTFGSRSFCDRNGTCPTGLMDLAPCYFGVPYSLSKGHFLDADPELLEQVEGLKPDKKKHSTYFIIEPKIGITLDVSASVQLNLVLKDVGFNAETRKLSDIIMPICHVHVKQPKLKVDVYSALRLIYVTGPYILLAVKIFTALTGLILAAYSARLVYWNWLSNNEVVFDLPPTSGEKIRIEVAFPLIDNKEHL